MQSLLVLIDGLGDEPVAMLDGKTPFDYARHPYMDKLSLNAASICENDIVPESCSCILRLLGVNREQMPQNRSYLELLAHGRDISEYEMVLRCNLVAIDGEGHLVSFNGGNLSSNAMASVAEICNGILKDVEFIHLSEYRNLLILNKEKKILECRIAPSQESLGENIDELLAEITKESLSLKYFLKEIEQRLKSFGCDGMRYRLYPWGPAGRETLPGFYTLHNLTGGVVGKAEIMRGIAKGMGMKLIVPEHATGDINTNVLEKAVATAALLERNDFVITHFNGADEAAHRYDAVGKAAFIQKIDTDFLCYISEKVRKPLKIVVCGDHITSSASGKHCRGKGPVAAGYLNGNKKVNISNYQDILTFLMGKSD